MLQYCLYFYICCVVILFHVSPAAATLAGGGGKRYDIQEEAMKLFSMPLDMVLAKFRVTADYMQILNDKLYDLKADQRTTMALLIAYYKKQLMDDIHLAFEDAKGDTKKYVVHSHNALVANVTDIQRLEQHRRRQNSVLTVAERNACKKFGYDMAGKTISALIYEQGLDQEAFGSVEDGQFVDVWTNPIEAVPLGTTPAMDSVNTFTKTPPELRSQGGDQMTQDQVGSAELDDVAAASRRFMSRARRVRVKNWFNFYSSTKKSKSWKSTPPQPRLRINLFDVEPV